MKSILLLFIFLSSILLAQTSPPANFENQMPVVSYLRGYGDTINFEGYPSYSAITDQYLSNGAIFSGYNGSGNPVTYDYGLNFWTSTLHSDDWYNPLKLKFVDPMNADVPMPISKLTFLNPIASEIDYINVTVYNENDIAIAKYFSTSPEWVTIDLGASIGAYVTFDDSFQTAFVIDEISFTQNGKPTSLNAVSDVSNHTIIYPNPLVSTATILIDPEVKVRDATFVLTDILGKRVMEVNGISKNSLVIERRNLPAGIYHYTLAEYGKLISNGIIELQ